MAFTNQLWNFAAEWAADGPFVTDYAQTRIYNLPPSTFTGLSGAVVAPGLFSQPVLSGGQITLN